MADPSDVPDTAADGGPAQSRVVSVGLKVVLGIVTLSIVLVALGGLGFIVARVFDLPALALGFGWLLLGAVGTTLAALAVALVVGLYHLYLYLFTDQKPLSLFATVPRDPK